MNWQLLPITKINMNELELPIILIQCEQIIIVNSYYIKIMRKFISTYTIKKNAHSYCTRNKQTQHLP